MTKIWVWIFEFKNRRILPSFYIYIYEKIEKQTQADRKKEREAKMNRQADRQIKSERERETQRGRDRQWDRKRDRDKYREIYIYKFFASPSVIIMDDGILLLTSRKKTTKSRTLLFVNHGLLLKLFQAKRGLKSRYR